MATQSDQEIAAQTGMIAFGDSRPPMKARGPFVNHSEVHPLDTKCLVLPDPVQEKTAGGIILSDATREKEAWKRQKCTLIAIGASAFQGWANDAPAPGDRVFVCQYAGSKIETDAGETYWIINDEDIIGGLIA